MPTVQASSSDRGAFRAGASGGGADVAMWANSSTTNFGSLSNTDLLIYTNSTVKGQWSTAGQLAINTTPSGAEKLRVNGNVISTANTDSVTYSVNGKAGANFSGEVTNITVVDGIVTAVS